MDQEGTGIRSQNDNVNCTIDTPSRDVIPESVEGEASEDGVSLKAEIESFEANPLIQNNVGKSNEGTAQDAVAGVMLGGDVQRFNIIPRCVVRTARTSSGHDLTTVVELRSLASPRTRMCVLRPYLLLPADRSSTIRACSPGLHRGMSIPRRTGLYICRFLYQFRLTQITRC